MDYSLEAQYEDRTHVEDGDCEDNLSDVEADAATLASAGYGTDEDYEHNLCD